MDCQELEQGRIPSLCSFVTNTAPILETLAIVLGRYNAVLPFLVYLRPPSHKISLSSCGKNKNTNKCFPKAAYTASPPVMGWDPKTYPCSPSGKGALDYMDDIMLTC